LKKDLEIFGFQNQIKLQQAKRISKKNDELDQTIQANEPSINQEKK